MKIIPILFEDNHLLVVEKPPNLLSQGDRTGDPDLLSILKQDLKERYNKPGNVYLGLVHRLDRPVGGVMVFAKTSKAAARLSDQIRKKEFKKTYIAVVRGLPPKQRGTLIHYLLKDEKTNKVVAVKKGIKGAKEAILDYEVISFVHPYSLVKINLHTGRPHQIRVQFSEIGYPLLGDWRYGFKDKNTQIALWAYKLSFEHPTLKKRVEFSALPENRPPWVRFSLSKNTLK
ncbi:MAG: RluA family pseudouridine synthase [Tepidanaerobacteraceae bacterium]|jgi:23S rRNA pseudouridine1911/1915/1917 synthase